MAADYSHSPNCSRLELSHITVESDETIQAAVTAIDRGRAQIALIVDKRGHLIGTLTDGDVRRGLLRGLLLTDSVLTVMQRNFRSVHRDTTEQEALATMRREHYHQLPVVNESNQPVALFVLEDLLHPKELPNQVLIMAGGRGERLLPLTSERPKPMLPLAGKPILEIILEWCISFGLSKFMFSVGHLKEQIIDYFGDGSRWGVEILYLQEERALGTAGALGLISGPLTSPVLVINGDVVTRANLQELLGFHQSQGADATMCVRPYEAAIPFGVVETEDNVLVGYQEKPRIQRHVNAGIYVLSPKLISTVPKDLRLDMPDLLGARLPDRRINVFPIHEYWNDVGSHDTLRKAQEDWS